MDTAGGKERAGWREGESGLEGRGERAGGKGRAGRAERGALKHVFYHMLTR